MVMLHDKKIDGKNVDQYKYSLYVYFGVASQHF
jgi:hypothetical protein